LHGRLRLDCRGSISVPRTVGIDSETQRSDNVRELPGGVWKRDIPDLPGLLMATALGNPLDLADLGATADVSLGFVQQPAKGSGNRDLATDDAG
jgi:hypothetical protein